MRVTPDNDKGKVIITDDEGGTARLSPEDVATLLRGDLASITDGVVEAVTERRMKCRYFILRVEFDPVNQEDPATPIVEFGTDGPDKYNIVIEAVSNVQSRGPQEPVFVTTAESGIPGGYDYILKPTTALPRYSPFNHTTKPVTTPAEKDAVARAGARIDGKCLCGHTFGDHDERGFCAGDAHVKGECRCGAFQRVPPSGTVSVHPAHTIRADDGSLTQCWCGHPNRHKVLGDGVPTPPPAQIVPGMSSEFAIAHGDVAPTLCGCGHPPISHTGRREAKSPTACSHGSATDSPCQCNFYSPADLTKQRCTCESDGIGRPRYDASCPVHGDLLGGRMAAPPTVPPQG